MTVEKRQFLSSLLEVSLRKMRWDSETDVDDLDDDDRSAFEQMRKASLRAALLHAAADSTLGRMLVRILGRLWSLFST